MAIVVKEWNIKDPKKYITKGMALKPKCNEEVKG